MTRPLQPGLLLEVVGLTHEFTVERGWLRRRVATVRVVDDVSFAVDRGEIVALVGESGSGKTTIARCIMRLLAPNSGAIQFAGEDLLALRGRALRTRRRDFQLVSQDPYASLDPRLSIGDTVSEPLAIHQLVPRRQRAERVVELLNAVGLAADTAQLAPHQLSAGQRQRVAIARALATGPRLLVADEPVSALDVSVRGQVMNVLLELRERLGLALLLIAHDLALVGQVAERVVVLAAGRVVESGPTAEVLSSPQHPQTRAMVAAAHQLPDPIL